MMSRNSRDYPLDDTWSELLFVAFSGWSLSEQSLETLIDRIGRST